jgi:uncharacterized membrane protein YjjB (DUF3815 family)
MSSALRNVTDADTGYGFFQSFEKFLWPYISYLHAALGLHRPTINLSFHIFPFHRSFMAALSVGVVGAIYARFTRRHPLSIVVAGVLSACYRHNSPWQNS